MNYFQLVAMIIGSFALGCTFTYLEIPILARLKAGQAIREEGPKSHMAKSGTPTMGGIAIFCSVVITCLCTVGFTMDLMYIIVSFFLFGLLGFLDDFIKVMKKHNLGLRAYQKLILQILISVFASLYHLKTADDPTMMMVPFMDEPFDLGLFYTPFTVFVIVAMANSVNLTDGLDGLATGTSAIVAITFAIIAKFAGAYPSAMFFAAVAGGCLGFLVFNRNPAKIFMGDTGSLALGGGLAVATIGMGGQLYLPIVGLIFVLETLSVIIQVASFKLTGKRIFKMAPLHHHFELSGLDEKKVVLIFYMFAAVCAAIGFVIYAV